MSDISLKKLGSSDISTYVSGFGGSNKTSVNSITGGWKFSSDDSSFDCKLEIMGQESIPVSALTSVQVLVTLNNTDYNKIPELVIRTQPKGDSSDYDSEYHDQVTYKVRNSGNYVKNNQYVFYFKQYEKDHLESKTTLREKMQLIETLGTHDPSLNIKSITFNSNNGQTFDYTVLSSSHNNTGSNKRQEIVTYSNFNIEDGLKSVESDVEIIKNRTQYKSRKGHGQIFLGTSGASSLIADSTILPVVDSSLRDGFYFQNTVASTKYNLYFFGGSSEVIRKSEITSLYSKLYIDNSSMPQFHIYTKPTGSNDAQPWYHTRWTYTFSGGSTFTKVGTEVLLTAINKPDVDFNVDVIESDGVLVDGIDEDGEVLYLTLSTNTGDTTDTVRHCVNLLGFTSEDSSLNKTEKNFNLVSRIGNNVGRVSKSLVSSETVAANNDIGDIIDLEALKTINIIGSATGNHPINIYHSVDGSTFYLDSEHNPEVGVDSNYHFNIKIQDELRYVKLVNGNTSNTFTLNYTVF
jgi:hypothetical protein